MSGTVAPIAPLPTFTLPATIGTIPTIGTTAPTIGTTIGTTGTTATTGTPTTTGTGSTTPTTSGTGSTTPTTSGTGSTTPTTSGTGSTTPTTSGTGSTTPTTTGTGTTPTTTGTGGGTTPTTTPTGSPVTTRIPPSTVAVSPSASVVPNPSGGPPIQDIIVNNENVNNNTLISQIIQQQAAVQTALNSTVVTQPTPPPSTPTLDTTDNFQVIDEGSQDSFHTPGDPYTGTVDGVDNQYINLNSTNLNITGITPNVFIQSGAGNDDISAYNGRNVLDAGGGSNVLIGGAGGQDTFLASIAPAATQGTQPFVDLIKNFHTGDDAIFRGLSASDFALKFTDQTGAFGQELVVTATSNTAGGPTASIALAGYSTGDLASAKLSVSFSTDKSGNPYMLIHSN